MPAAAWTLCLLTIPGHPALAAQAPAEGGHLGALLHDDVCSHDGLGCSASWLQLRAQQLRAASHQEVAGTQRNAGVAPCVVDAASSPGGDALDPALLALPPNSSIKSAALSGNGTGSVAAASIGSDAFIPSGSKPSDPDAGAANNDDASTAAGGASTANASTVDAKVAIASAADARAATDGDSYDDDAGATEGVATNTSTSNTTGATAKGLTARDIEVEDIEAEPKPLWTSSRLRRPSTAPLRTFYMYRAVSDKVYPPLNVNTASLPGVLWYLHNEVVQHVPRKFGITKIIRMRVQTRATQPLFERGMNFGSRLAFDSGQATGPFQCKRHGEKFSLCGTAVNSSFHLGQHRHSSAGAFEWDAYGYYVGCNNLGSFPFPTYPVQYPHAIWYSLPGPCPSRLFEESDETCEERQPGGLCEGPPTGQGNCTWSYEMAGEISLDELTGITDHWPSYKAFLATGRREYDKRSDRGVGFTWWDSITDRLANKWRIRKAEKLFERRYPNSTKASKMYPPPCDFNYWSFYKDPAYYHRPCHTARPKEHCFADMSYAKYHGIITHPEWYPGLSRASSLHDFQAFLHRTGPTLGHCAMPCDDEVSTCHTAVKGERCWKDVQFAMRVGIRHHPEWYMGLSPLASFEEFQSYLFETGKAKSCKAPCTTPAARAAVL